MPLAEIENSVDEAPALWGPPSLISTTQRYISPRCTRANGIDWVIWTKSIGNNLSLIYYTFLLNGVWFEQSHLEVHTSSVPAITAHDNEVHLVWRNAEDNKIMWKVCDAEGWSWRTPSAQPNVRTFESPALTSYEGKLHLAWSDGESKSKLAYAWFDGREWGAPQRTDFAINSGPSMAAVGDTLYFAFNTDDDGHIGYCALSAGKIQPPRKVDVIAEGGPELASDGEQLWTAWKVKDSASVMVAVGTPTTGLVKKELLSNARTESSPGLWGDPSGLQAVWQDSFTGGIYTATTVNVGTVLNNTVSGRAGPGEFISLSVDKGDTSIWFYSTKADANGTWSVTVDGRLTKGMILSATAAKDLSSRPSDAFVVVLGTYQPGCLFVSYVGETVVMGTAPQAGQIIRGWRSSDGKKVVDYPVPPPIALYEGKDFTAPFLPNMSLAKGDILNLVAQFPNNGTMTPFVSKPEGYSVTWS